MRLNKKDKDEIAAMIGNAVLVAGPGVEVDPEDIFSAATDPDLLYLRKVRGISVITRDDETRVRIHGEVQGADEPGRQEFYFPPNDDVYLQELKRVQSYGLWSYLMSIAFSVNARGDKTIHALRVGLFDPDTPFAAS